MKAKLADVARKLTIIVSLAIVFTVSLATSVYYTFRGSEVQVPPLGGKSIEQARLLAREAGLEVKVVAQDYDEKIAANAVLGQEPESGTKVKSGFTVRVRLSLGKRTQ